MIISIFKKSNPINLVLTSLIVLFSFLLAQFQIIEKLTTSVFLHKITQVFVVVLTVLLTDFIVKKNKITGQNSFVALFFSLFFFFFWGSNDDFRLVFSNVFVLLAVRKIISMKSQNNTTKKILDAGLCICIATLFHFWAILFFAVLYTGIIIYAQNNYKHWLVPFVSVFIVLILLNANELFFNDSFFSFSNSLMSLEYSSFDTFYNWVAVSFFAVILLISLFFLPSRINSMLQKNKLSYLILFFALLVAVIVILVSTNKTRSLLIFMYFPTAIFFATFFEKIKKKTIQTIIFYTMLIVSIVFGLLSVY